MASNPLGRSTLGVSVERVTMLQQRKEILEDMRKGPYSKDKIKKFKKAVRPWYPVYEEFGKNRVYPQSSIFWRMLTYIPYLRDIAGFESFEKLGKEAAKKDIGALKAFLAEDIEKKINDISKKITESQIANDEKRNSL